MKRFYKEARAGALDEEGLFGVFLDERPVRTPASSLLGVQTRALAEALAEEWAAQGERVEPSTMPLNQLACSALDLVAKQRENEVEELAAYGGSELLCYWADRPAELARLQEEHWQPLLDWAARVYDAPLTLCRGIIHQPQPEASLIALRRQLEAMSDQELAAMSLAVRSSGSLLIALALKAGRIDSAQAFEAAELDASYQIDQWGEDEEARRRREGVRSDLAAAARFWELLAA